MKEEEKEEDMTAETPTLVEETFVETAEALIRFSAYHRRKFTVSHLVRAMRNCALELDEPYDLRSWHGFVLSWCPREDGGHIVRASVDPGCLIGWGNAETSVAELTVA
jgi:hypothetical protein